LWPFKIIAVLAILLGFWLIIGGMLPGVAGAGSHVLVGYERLLGLVPLAVGLIILLGAISKS